jgi:N-acetylmuramoyl-L-alanine amidase
VTLRPYQILKATTTLILGAISCLSLHSQTPFKSATGFNRNVIVLDPAHGGNDTGAHLSDQVDEKDVTLSFASTLRTLLTTAGFTVVSTRDADPAATAPPLTNDLRAGTANHPRAIACILIHATASGTGIHISTSTLPEDSPDETSNVIPWETAQASYIGFSHRLANTLGVALVHDKIPTLIGRTTVPPIDNLTCPAIALEIAPLASSDSDATPVSDSAYQQRIAQAISTALTTWRTQLDPSASPARTTGAPATKPAPKPQPAPLASKPITPKPAAPKPTTSMPAATSAKPTTAPSSTPKPIPPPKPASPPPTPPQAAPKTAPESGAAR